MEGPGISSFPQGRLRLESRTGAEMGQAANFVLWFPVRLPEHFVLSWDFWPIQEPGLGMVLFSATGVGNVDITDPGLAPRDGRYDTYHSGDINLYHLSYFRRRLPDEIRFHTCNLRKSRGFHLVAQGADPIPAVREADGPYHLELVALNGEISFSIDGLVVLRWRDDGSRGGAPLCGGAFGFRQMAPLIAEYANLQAFEALLPDGPRG